jgi:hypothetical protein
VNAAFGTFFGALIGFVLLPWSTLMYLTVYPGGIFGFESVALSSLGAHGKRG